MEFDLTEQGKFYEKFNDQSPLTDETLKELGFKKQMVHFYADREPDGRYYWDMKIRGCILTADGTRVNGEAYQWYVTIDPYPDFDSFRFKTVGSVKMLIEALKGDECKER